MFTFFRVFYIRTDVGEIWPVTPQLEISNKWWWYCSSISSRSGGSIEVVLVVDVVVVL